MPAAARLCRLLGVRPHLEAILPTDLVVMTAHGAGGERTAQLGRVATRLVAEPDVARTLERFLSDVTTTLGQFLVTRQAGGEIAAGVDTTAAARAFQGALFVHLLTTSLTPWSVGPERDEETVAGLVTVLLRGMAPREEPSVSKSDAHRETVS